MSCGEESCRIGGTMSCCSTGNLPALPGLKDRADETMRSVQLRAGLILDLKNNSTPMTTDATPREIRGRRWRRG
jgi:hypothetical protein